MLNDESITIPDTANPKNEPPADLGAAGRETWDWLLVHCNAESVENVRPLAIELCRTADRLAQIRERIASRGLEPGGKRNALLPEEARVSKQFALLWRSIGLADHDPETKRPVGRPAHMEPGLWR
jgi:hypothetical protein